MGKQSDYFSCDKFYIRKEKEGKGWEEKRKLKMENKIRFAYM